MMTKIPARPTRYKDILFRSALEARWAAFFDHIAWGWTYEPDGPPGYIPDFLIRGDHPFYVEVKPVDSVAAAKSTMQELVRPKIGTLNTLPHALIIVGITPVLGTVVRSKLVEQQFERRRKLVAVECSPALIGGFAMEGHECCDEEMFWVDVPGPVTRVGLANEVGGFVVLPHDVECDGNSAVEFLDPPDQRWIEKQWAHATNATRWRP